MIVAHSVGLPTINQSMASLSFALILIAGMMIGFFVGRALAKSEGKRGLAESEARYKAELAAANARLDAAAAEKQHMRDTFSGVAAEALRNNSASFLQLAKTELARESVASRSDLERSEKAISALVVPIQQGLETYQAKIAEIEKERATTFGSLRAELESVVRSNRDLEAQTQSLVTSLKTPHVRGRWGEIQLQNTVELAGMLEHCDFTQQHHITTADGNGLRPDMTIKLPGGRTIVVDSKVSLTAYLEAADEPDDARRAALLKRHAAQIRTHADALKKKGYWEQFPKSPEFVVMFIPGEAFFSAALQADPTLLEELVGDNVILATPTTLIALLKTAAQGWKQELVVRDAEEISKLGKELYERMALVCQHIGNIGNGLDSAVGSYNAAIGSLESRLLVTGRRFKGMGAVGTEEIPILAPVLTAVRRLSAPELLPTIPDQKRTVA
jgi:DNA recombination protein RmuC